ncbi:hypothetical protein [Treponema putidum]|uniref:hypothetical protein n=1 Tax=Treponema putidum TaxID=221027 RepID=UPI001FE0DEC8|nr:hypothetical protein [Treponema putidum]
MKFKYVIKRLLIAVPTFLGITFFTYLILSMAGSPLDAYLADPRITVMELERKRNSLGLDQSIFIQYFIWLKNFLIWISDFRFNHKDP